MFADSFVNLGKLQRKIKMDENDKELTRKAIEEILREAKEHRERDEICPINERKVNPLGKTNKQFLGRTINAMVRHNERTDERTRRRCHKKLRELDERHRGRSRTISEDNHKQSKKRKEKERRTSTDDSSERERKMQLKTKRKKKHKRRKKLRRLSKSSSSIDSLESGLSLRNTSRERQRERHWSKESNEFNRNRVHNEVMHFEMQNFRENLAAWMVPPMLWTAPLEQLYQYKALMALGADQAKTNETVQIDELSVSSSSLSDVNFEEVTKCKSSGNVTLTVNLSTEDEEEPCTMSSKILKSKSSKKNPAIETNCIEVYDSSSNTSKKSSAIIELTDSDTDETSKETSGEILVDGADYDALSVNSIISLKSTDSKAAIDLTEE